MVMCRRRAYMILVRNSACPDAMPRIKKLVKVKPLLYRAMLMHTVPSRIRISDCIVMTRCRVIDAQQW